MRKIFLLLLLNTTFLFAQWDRYHPEYNWYTIKGKHVQVHFHEGAERTARLVAKIADEVWTPLTRLYKYEPETVHFVIKDIDDYSNGATYFFDNKIEIWASALDFELRGAHNWLRNVISHEFTHMVQIQASMKTTRRIPAFYLQFMNYEDKRRPDILYGFPNVIVSYPLAMVNVPSWFAEGTAQYMRKEFHYDDWDTHRDMILRCYALDNNMLTWNQMGVFGKTSLGNESVYNSGFALVRYIAQKYGEDKLRKISEKLGVIQNFTIDAAFEDVLGKDGNQIYNEWSNFVKSDYQKRSEKVLANLVEGKKIFNEGFGNFHPRFSKDGSKIYFLSNKGEDYLSLSSLYELDLKTGKERLLINDVHTTFSVLADTNKILYAKLSDDNKNWINIHDLYIYDLKTKEEKRLTKGLRANNPSISHDGKMIVFVYQKDGTSNLGIVNIDGKKFKRITFFENGEQVYNPKFSEDDSYILFDYSYHEGRDIGRVDTNGSNFELIMKSNYDERNPVEKNGAIYYSCDKTGIFNIYKYDLETGTTTQLTNVIGGAFMPAVYSDGRIAYAGYTSTGYKLFLITPQDQAKVDTSAHYVWRNNPPLSSDKPNGDFTKAEIDSLRHFNDYEVPDYKLYKYKGTFTRMSFFPFVRYDNYNTSNKGIDKIKPGVYFTSSDMLNRYSIFGGGSINRRMERDLFLMLEYRNRLPLLYSLGLKPQLSLELYSVSRKTDVDIVFDPNRSDYIVPTDVTYDLFQVDVAAKQKIIGKGHNLEFRFSFSRYTAALGSFIIPHTTTLYPSMSDEYFIGRSLQLKYTYKSTSPSVNSDINPVGRMVEFQYSYDFDKYNPDSQYKIEDGVLVPLYKNYNFHRVELNWKECLEVGKKQTLSLRFRAGSIIGATLPDFFDFYLGGFIGMKSYPFYAISGNKIGWLNLTYRFPLFTNIDERVGHLYLDKIFLSLFADFGNAWKSKFPGFSDFKKGAGLELRAKMVSFYIFPTSFFVSAAYSFDKFSREYFGERITYGKEWRFYGGILFDFSL